MNATPESKSEKEIRNAVIITAKGGNTSVENKNAVPILGLPVLCYPIRAAKLAASVDLTVLTTENELLENIALKEGVDVIKRPDELSKPESEHKEVIEHAVRKLEQEHPSIDNIVVLLGNTVMVTPGIIDKALKTLEEDECDSVATVWKAQDDHPYRALTMNKDGYAESLLDKAVSSNRQSYPPVYYYDQGVWAFKKHCAYEQKGPAPWVWLGERCKLIERPWVTGRDIHSWIDVSASAWYLSSVQASDHCDYIDL